MNIETVRVLGDEIDPRRYFVGWKGFILRAANAVRTLLERSIGLHILRVEARLAGLNNAQVEQLVAESKDQPSMRPWWVNDLRRQAFTSRANERASYGSLKERPTHRQLYPARANTELKTVSESPLAFTLAKHEMAHGNVGRSVRYFAGRGHRVTSVQEDNFLSVPPMSWSKNDDQ